MLRCLSGYGNQLLQKELRLIPESENGKTSGDMRQHRDKFCTFAT
jgi:hypothetical protein